MSKEGGSFGNSFDCEFPLVLVGRLDHVVRTYILVALARGMALVESESAAFRISGPVLHSNHGASFMDHLLISRLSHWSIVLVARTFRWDLATVGALAESFLLLLFSIFQNLFVFYFILWNVLPEGFAFVTSLIWNTLINCICPANILYWRGVSFIVETEEFSEPRCLLLLLICA